MKLRMVRVFVMVGLLVGASWGHAASVVFDFNGTGFDFEFGDWRRNTFPGPTAITIGNFATERGGAGLLLAGLLDFTDADVSLTLQLDARNAASELRVTLLDLEDDRAVYAFPLSSFSPAALRTVVLPDPTFLQGPGPVNFSQIRRVDVSGDFSSEDFLALRLDRLAIDTPTPAPVPEPAALFLVGTGLVALLWQGRRRARVTHP